MHIRLIAKVSIILTVLLWCQSLTLANTIPDKVLTYFSGEYHEARNTFLNAVRSNEGRINSYQNPRTGPIGKALFLDVASFGSENPQIILVLGSGTHGVEGFAGSALQTGLLLQGTVSRLPPNVGLVMIHAINPYGFAHLRRFNEDNVDVNRNFLDHSKPHPLNDGYTQLAHSIAPQSLSFWSNAESLTHLLWFLLKHGKLALQQAISSGQYSHSSGLFYGGVKAAWSNETIRMIASRHLSMAKKIIFIDFHTGLGDYGNAEVIMNVSKESPAYERAKVWWGDIVKSTVSGEAVSAHFHGSLKRAFPKMLPQSEVTAVSLEFGTVPNKNVLWALRSENCLYHWGDNPPDSKQIKDNLLRAFYPDDKTWKLDVWQKGKKVVEQVLDKL
jgi:hypothetical protein